MDEKKLLVLAASTYQVDAILKAKALGFRVITTDNAPGNPGHRLADRSYAIDTTDRERVLDLARRERVDGVIAPATDVAVETAAHVAAALALPGPPLEGVAVLTSKCGFRRFLKRQGLPCPGFLSVRAATAPADLIGLPDGPWIVKPNRASGSKGVVIVDSREAIAEPLRQALGLSLDGEAIIEQWLDGTQHTCEGFLSGGALAFVVVTDRRTASRPYAATSGHFVPSRLDRRAYDDLMSQLHAVFAALGIRDGPFDCDFVSTPNGVYLLEATARLGGNSLSALIEAACEFDIVQAAVQYACGQRWQIPVSTRQRPAAVLILGVDAEGTLWFDAEEAESLRNEPWVRRLVVDKPLGTFVRPFINGRERVGEALLIGRDRDDLDRRVAELAARLGLVARAEAVCS